MNSAIIGLGVIAGVHVDAIKAINANLTCVCESDEQKAKDFLKSHDIDCKIYTDYKEMLLKEDIDVVHICTPHFLHESMCIFALENNINVLCEKPLCISKDGIDKIIEAQNKSNAQVAVCLQNRYNPANAYVKKLLGNDCVTYGAGAVKWCRTKEYYQSGDWRGKKETEGGGVLINQALHTIDLIQWLCGMPISLSADLSNEKHGYIEVEDTAVVQMKMENCTFDFCASVCESKDFPIEIYLETANDKKITICDNVVTVNGEMTVFEEETTQTVKACYGNSHPRLFADFYNCVKTGEKFSIDADEGSKVIKMIFAMYSSNGKSIEL